MYFRLSQNKKLTGSLLFPERSLSSHGNPPHLPLFYYHTRKKKKNRPAPRELEKNKALTAGATI
jgi:hypothetical protein